MDSERDLRAGFRRALDEVVPPAPWLEAAVTETLRERRSRKSVHRSAGPVSPALRRPFVQLAAGVLIVLLAATAVAAFVELRSLSPRSAPASTDVKAYQSMVGRDLYRLENSGDLTSCATLQSVCPAPGKPVLNALQRFLDDLNASEPPASFAIIDAQLRRHLVAGIADLNMVFAAYRAQDQNGLDNAGSAMALQTGPVGWVQTIAAEIVSSHPGTAAEYLQSVRSGKDNLAACPPCQALGSASQNDCTEMQAIGNQGCLVNAMTTIEVFEGSLVGVLAPNSLAAQDTHLQRDLALADNGILDIANAELSGDRAGFSAGRLLYQQALPAINADIAAILGG